jgi:hypothetical protein
MPRKNDFRSAVYFTLISIFFLIILVACQGTRPEEINGKPTLSLATEVNTPEPTSTSQPEIADPLILAHYMPWYQTPQITGYWGWHWTMNYFDPNKLDANGLQELASYYHPLTGAYDSSDENLLEYQALMMKLSGIDGVIADWYGAEPFLDYAVIDRASKKLIDVVNKAGLDFVICYEDQTIRHMVENGYLVDNEIYNQAQKELRYFQEVYASNPAYLKLEDRPVLFIFGPQYFINYNDWLTIFSIFDEKPQVFTLDGKVGAIGDGSYPWPPMHLAQNGLLSTERLKSYLDSFYNDPIQKKYRAASAFPGFADIYKEAGLGYDNGVLSAQQGETFAQTLEMAFQSQPAIIQLVTWNDYGEGTIIEPTVEFGYKYLEMVIEKRREYIDAEFPYSVDDLDLPLRLFTLRNQYAGDKQVQLQLDQVFNAVVVGDLEAARNLLDRFP